MSCPCYYRTLDGAGQGTPRAVQGLYGWQFLEEGRSAGRAGVVRANIGMNSTTIYIQVIVVAILYNR